MKTLYIECNMGAAGDMLMAALLELYPKPDAFVQRMNSLGLPGVTVEASPSVKCGITGTHIDVRVHGEEEHSHDVEAGAHSHGGHSHGEGSHAHHGHTHTHDEAHAHEHPHKEGHHSHAHVHKDTHHTHAHSHDGGHKHDHDAEHGHAHPHTHDDGHTHAHKSGHAHTHSHTGLAEIETLLAGLPVPQAVRNNALAVYRLIADAEAHAHGRPVEQVHFHEVGNLDAVADVVGVCLLMDELAPDEVVVSPVHVGSGFVRCAHGVLPVPAPATAHILQGVPSYTGNIKGELCTPTGAALLKHFATRFGPQPVMAVDTIGYGMGKKDFEAANCVRVFLGNATPIIAISSGGMQGMGVGVPHGDANGPNGEVAELRCNLDDMTGEAIGYTCELLLQAGARDVFTTPVQMKKGRPAVLLTCVCDAADADKFAALLLRHTTTFGVRKTLCQRYVLQRGFTPVPTPYGDIRLKTGQGYGVHKAKPEYEDVAAAARQHNVPLAQVLNSLPEQKKD